MYQIDDLLLFVLVVENKSFRQTSIQLGTTQPTISRRMKSLSDDLGFELFIHDGRNFAITDFGNNLYNVIKQTKNAFDELRSSVSELINNRQGNAGNLRIHCPSLISETYITPHLTEFMLTYPHISLDINYSFEAVDFSDDLYDIAFIDYIPIQQNQKFIKVLDHPINFYCTKKYAIKYGIPSKVSDLTEHRIVNMNIRGRKVSKLEFTHLANGHVELFNIDSMIAINNLRHAFILLKGNEVIAPCLETLCKDDDTLIKILPDYKINISNSIYMLKNPFKNNAIMDIFINFIKKKIIL